MLSYKHISEKMITLGVKRIIFKALSNNDNSKQQIYLGSDFDVIKVIPSGEVYSSGISKKGPIFKAPLNFYWINENGNKDYAPNAQLILYPKYPEIRVSGFITKTSKSLNIAPRHLMQPPTKEERKLRIDSHRYLILGIGNDTIYAYCTSWDDELAKEIAENIDNGKTKIVASVFSEIPEVGISSEDKLVAKLKSIYLRGNIESCRLKADGSLIPYKAQNGAGYTLEAQFGITPNGNPEPDFMDWELKSHSGSTITLMTPEPNTGIYIDDGLEIFLKNYGTNIKDDRMDFASRHKVNNQNQKTALLLVLEGYDSKSKKIVDPNGGLMLRDNKGKLTAGWSFNKIIEHWKKKHSNACYVSYTTIKEPASIRYHFGPLILLAQGTTLEQFLEGLNNGVIYYDPGINMKLIDNKWRPKKRNQFRVNQRELSCLYTELKTIDLRLV